MIYNGHNLPGLDEIGLASGETGGTGGDWTEDQESVWNYQTMSLPDNNDSSIDENTLFVDPSSVQQQPQQVNYHDHHHVGEGPIPNAVLIDPVRLQNQHQHQQILYQPVQQPHGQPAGQMYSVDGLIPVLVNTDGHQMTSDRGADRRLSIAESDHMIAADENSNASSFNLIEEGEFVNCSGPGQLQQHSTNHSLQTIQPSHADQQFNQLFARLDEENNEPSATGRDVSCVDYPGCFKFQVTFTKLPSNTKNKHWTYSEVLGKLFIDMNKFVQVEFKIGPNPPPNLLIRAVPVFTEAAHCRDPVKRCPTHADEQHPTNQDFPYVEHLIRFQSSDTRYMEDMESGRLSACFAAGVPHQGTDISTRLIKFMCLNSDVGGMNRRPIKIVFTLELKDRVVGRKCIDVRICSCPKRDCQQEEKKLEKDIANAKQVAHGFAVSTTIPDHTTVHIQPPPGKRIKMDKDKIIMLPVHADDFKKLNEFCESAWCAREPQNADQIKETRRRLLEKHNADLIKKIINKN